MYVPAPLSVIRADVTRFTDRMIAQCSVRNESKTKLRGKTFSTYYLSASRPVFLVGVNAYGGCECVLIGA